MTSSIDARLRRLEALQDSVPSYVVHVEDGADEAAAIVQHQRRTGYTGPVIVAPIECSTAEEWTTRYAAPGHSRDG